MRILSGETSNVYHSNLWIWENCVVLIIKASGFERRPLNTNDYRMNIKSYNAYLNIYEKNNFLIIWGTSSTIWVVVGVLNQINVEWKKY